MKCSKVNQHISSEIYFQTLCGGQRLSVCHAQVTHNSPKSSEWYVRFELVLPLYAVTIFVIFRAPESSRIWGLSFERCKTALWGHKNRLNKFLGQQSGSGIQNMESFDQNNEYNWTLWHRTPVLQLFGERLTSKYQ